MDQGDASDLPAAGGLSIAESSRKLASEYLSHVRAFCGFLHSLVVTLLGQEEIAMAKAKAKGMRRKKKKKVRKRKRAKLPDQLEQSELSPTEDHGSRAAGSSALARQAEDRRRVAQAKQAVRVATVGGLQTATGTHSHCCRRTPRLSTRLRSVWTP